MAIAAIPTKYNGVQFRSRLEARWAAMFDLLGRAWEYEPIDLAGWIPDFRSRGLLIEVCPVSALAPHEKKILEATPWEHYPIVDILTEVPTFRVSFVGGKRFEHERGDLTLTDRLWKDAGNRVQWRGVGAQL